MIAGFMFGLIVLFVLVGGVCWLLILLIRHDSWSYDRSFVWMKPNGEEPFHKK